MITATANAVNISCKRTPFQATASDAGFPISIRKITFTFTCHPDFVHRSLGADEANADRLQGASVERRKHTFQTEGQSTHIHTTPRGFSMRNEIENTVSAGHSLWRRIGAGGTRTQGAEGSSYYIHPCHPDFVHQSPGADGATSKNLLLNTLYLYTYIYITLQAARYTTCAAKDFFKIRSYE